MKKILVVCLLVFAAAFGFSASEDMELYSYLYDGAQTHEEQYSLLQVITDLEIPGAGDFYAGALRRLVMDYPNIRSATEREYADGQAILLSNLLGQEKHIAAAPELWRVVDSLPPPLVKAEALMALGKMRATDFLPQVVKLLTDLNGAPTPDPLNGERIAFGAIIALEKYQDISGYLPVYFAAAGWYADRIKTQAQKSLELISPDPTQPMITIIKSSGYNYETKFAALRTIETSNASRDSKSSVAIAAFDEGWRSTTNDVRLRGQLNAMRKTAMGMIRGNGASDAAVYPLLERSYKQFADVAGGDRDEAIDAIVTLRTLATEDAARSLSRFVMTINTKLQSGTLTRKDEDLVRELIPALGATGQASARQVLNVVNSLNWTSSVKTLAQEALSKLP